MSQHPEVRVLPAVSSLEVRRLFGCFDVRVEMAPGGVTLLHGTNGAGKSTLLRILRGVLSNSALTSEPFSAAKVDFADGSMVVIDRESGTWTERFADGGTTRGELRDIEQGREFERYLVHRTTYRQEGSWIVDRVGRPITLQELNSIRQDFGRSARARQYAPRDIVLARHDRSASHSAGGGEEAVDGARRRLVTTCRLIRSDRLLLTAEQRQRRQGGDSEPQESQLAVEWIAKKIGKFVGEAREHSRSRASEIDGSFFDRAIRALAEEQPLSAEGRRGLVERLEHLHARLKACALATTELGLRGELMRSRNPNAVQAMLDLYLQDMLDKASASDYFLERLEIFIQTLNSHLVEKTVELDNRRGLRVRRSADQDEIQLSRLSSGEQHLIVLFYALVFENKSVGVCLIDEPEISLNVDWQHRFVSTVASISRIAPQQFIIATHSPVVARDHQELLRPVERMDGKNAFGSS